MTQIFQTKAPVHVTQNGYQKQEERTSLNGITTLCFYKLYFTEKEYINLASYIFEGMTLSV